MRRASSPSSAPAPARFTANTRESGNRCKWVCFGCTFSSSRRSLGGGGGLTRLPRAVFAVRRGAPGRSHELRLSLRVHQLTLVGCRPTGGTGDGHEGRQVECCIVVPVDDQAAALAVVTALGQGQLGFHCLAPRARFRRWVPAVGDHECCPIPLGLVSELTSQLGGRAVEQGPVEAGFASPVPRASSRKR